MASLDSLELKVDALATAVAEMRGELKGKLHESPCPELVKKIAELQDGHVRPLEDSNQRVRGVLWAVGTLAIAGTVLGGIEVIARFIK